MWNPHANEARFDEPLRSYRARADRIAAGTNGFMLVVCAALAPVNGTFIEWALIGLPTMLLSVWVARTTNGELAGRLYNAAAFMIFTGLLIHQTGGDIEAHFSAFGLIGVLLYYRDWRTIFVGTVVIYLHHLVFGLAQVWELPIFVFDDPNFWTLWFTHVAYFLPFVGMMGYLSIWLRREGFAAQEVIEMAESIVHGNFHRREVFDELEAAPLVVAVSTMKNRLIDLIEVSPVATAIVRRSDGMLLSVNQAWRSTLGVHGVGTIAIDREPFWPADDSWGQLVEQLIATSEGYLVGVEMPLRTTSGSELLCQMSLVRLDTMEPEMVVVTFDDITARRRAEETMLELAYHDSLTGLPNRVRLLEDLQTSYDRFLETADPFVVAFVDLDHFKPVNDRYGHAVGDDVLRIVGRRLASSYRSNDVVARLGGDEFAVVLNSCNSVESARRITDAAISAISEPINIGEGATVSIGASYGLVLAHAEVDVKQLLSEADEAMYKDKARSREEVR